MNDDPAFDDPAFDELRALLADAREPGPVPDDVAARLDATLMSLQAERAARPGSDRTTAVVVPLRRRLAPRLLVAAAAMVVVATGSVGIMRAISDTGGDDAATAESSTSDDAGGSVQPAAPRSDGPAQELDGASDQASAGAELSSATFARDAARVMRAAATAAEAEAPANDTGDTDTGTAEPFADRDADGTTPAAPPLTASSGRLDTLLRQTLEACSGPAVPGAVTLTARLDDAPVALVFRPPTESGQLVEAWSCDGTRLLVSATVPR